MAGGKETPRQKMIGMMYLVLTALLALNVSKSILDAFVAIEENIQKANIVQADRGTGFYNDVKSEMAATKGADQVAKKKKLEYVLKQMDAIDKETEKVIEFIDKMKLEILNTAGENTGTYKDKDHLTLMWKKQDGVKPIRMNCAAVQGKDKYDEPMHVMGVAADIKRPTGNGAELWKKYNDFRSKIVELAGSYQMPGSEKKFDVKVKAMNDFENYQDLQKKVTKMIEGTKGNLKEDKQVLIDLYMMLSKPEKNEVHGMEGVHWVGMTFDHAPLVAGIAALSSMQQDVLSARALALANYKAKVSTGEYSFNKIAPLAYGPFVMNNGEEGELKVMMAAFDSDNNPKVTVTEGVTVDPEGGITYKDGQGIVKFKAGSSNMTIKGTVSIKNKSGVAKTETWTHEVVVMKPQGTVSLPEMNVLYRGYNNLIEGVASGYDQTSLNGSNVSLSKKGNQWIGKPGSGREASISVVGKNSVTGQTANLGTFKFRVSNLPPPQVYLGTIGTGSSVSPAAIKSMTKLFAKYPPEIPLNATFAVASYEVTVSGAPRSVMGTGPTLSPAAQSLLRQAKSGAKVSISAKYKGMGYSGNMATIINIR